jgi:carboxylesterase type B
MSEDCLTLNVYIPKKATGHWNSFNYYNRKRKYPVLVWIHGGFNQANSAGSPYYEASNLSSTAGIIVVTLNYRLGMI